MIKVKFQEKDLLVKEGTTVFDLIEMLRMQGFFELDDIESAFLEVNGSLSVRPKTNRAPTTPEQISLEVEDGGVPMTVISDGTVVNSSLEYLGISREDLNLLLKEKNKSYKEIFLRIIFSLSYIITFLRWGIASDKLFFKKLRFSKYKISLFDISSVTSSIGESENSSSVVVLGLRIKNKTRDTAIPMSTKQLTNNIIKFFFLDIKITSLKLYLLL